jgi:P-type Ca2+ transporter type 2C
MRLFAVSDRMVYNPRRMRVTSAERDPSSMSLLSSPDQHKDLDIADIARLPGLSDQEAAQRLQREGANELPTAQRRTIWRIALEIVSEPMFALLIGGGVVYLFLGDVREAAVLLGSIVLIMLIDFSQENRTEHALEALRDLSSPRALVIRNGKHKRIAGREVVRGDLVVLAEGDRVPADGTLLWQLNLSADESLLTGESLPVRKRAWHDRLPAEMGRPGGDDLPFVYSGSLITQGQGVAEVLATGARTELGQIGKALEAVKPEKTRLQRETGRLVRVVAIVGAVLCLLAVLLYGLLRGQWLHGILAGIALAMAILPEEFPVVLTIFLALGAWRIARQQVLTRRTPAIETLGEATVLCVDKTGTLTQNRMSVRRLFAADAAYEVTGSDTEEATSLPETLHALVEYSLLASQQAPFDPMEQALRSFGERALAQTEHLHRDWILLREYPLSPTLLALSHVWKAPQSDDSVVAVKGAPEAIFDLCHLRAGEREALSRQVGAMADDGLRVLGVARAAFTHAEQLPTDQHEFHFEILGLVGLADPVRPKVPQAVRECSSAGIRVIMITGDYAGTARHIAREIGLQPDHACLTGPELDALDDAGLQERVRTVDIFARVVPQQKLRLVNALKANGEIVAMTGDGVNDAPALKAAHIGIAMGSRGTDVAREAAALVLLDDDFSSIVQAIKLGRRIYENIRKALAYILAIHVPIAALSLLPLFFGWPLVLLPVQIVFLELIIDPASSVVFESEPESPQVMRRPPRDPHQPMFSGRLITLSLLQGVSVLASVLAVLLLSLSQGRSEPEVRAMTFTTLVFANLGLIFVNRSQSRSALATLRARNAAFWWVMAGGLLLLAFVLFVPGLRDLFSFSRLSAADLLLCLGAGIIGILWFEIAKLLRRRSGSAGKAERSV